MSIFDEVEKAESMNANDLISISAGEFLDLIDIWICCGYLISEIEKSHDKRATEAIFKIADLYTKLGEKYA